MNKSPLGESDSYYKSKELLYAPELLFAIPRSINRNKLFIDEQLPFSGWDRWNAYEFSWLDKNGKPQAACLSIDIPCESFFIVESKSLKLYLNSFSFKKFENASEVLDCINKDLVKLLHSQIKLDLVTLQKLSKLSVMTQENLGLCLDTITLDEELDFSKVDAQLLLTETTSTHEIVSTHLFRSLCPVTNQPDWASIVIEYQGIIINHSSLLRYLLSFRQHQGFHEDCVERIFCDLKQMCLPEKISVYAAFTRRGGIDINPFRSNFQNQIPFARLARQ